MFGFWEWLIILVILAWIVIPYANKMGKSAKKVQPKRENQVYEEKREPTSKEVPYSPEEEED